MQAVQLWVKVQYTQLRQDTLDVISWRWTADGIYAAASAYAAQFEGAIRTNYRALIWCSDAPVRCRIFAWLAVKGCCLTVDALARRGWPHNEECPLCLSHPEIAVHLLNTCPMAMQLWCTILQRANLPPCLLPQPDQSLTAWLSSTQQLLPRFKRKAWTSLTHLVWWSIWKERNAHIFQAHAATLDNLMAKIVEEAMMWQAAGRPRACSLLQRPREPD